MKLKKTLIVFLFAIILCGIIAFLALFRPFQKPAEPEPSPPASSEYVKPPVIIPEVESGGAQGESSSSKASTASAPEVLLENAEEKQTNLADAPVIREEVVLPKQSEPEDPGM